MNPSLIFYASFVVVLLIVQVGFYFAIKRYTGKWSGQKTANAVLLSMPATMSFVAIIIANSFSSIRDQPPPAIESFEPIDSIERAAKRIDYLEVHTAYLENYLLYERRRQIILVTGLSAIVFVSLFVVGLAMYKPTEDE